MKKEYALIKIIILLLFFTKIVACFSGCENNDDLDSDIITDEEMSLIEYKPLVVLDDLFDESPVHDGVQNSGSEDLSSDTDVPISHDVNKDTYYSVDSDLADAGGAYIESDIKSGDEDALTYVLNINTKKFHLESCKSVGDISPKNKDTHTDRDFIISIGYIPCKRCNP